MASWARDTGEVGVQDDVVGSGLAVGAVRLLAQLLVESVDGLEHPVDTVEPVLEVAESSVDLVEIDHAVVALHRELQYHVRARYVRVGGGAFGGDERLLDGEVREHDVGVEESGVGAGHVVVDLGDHRHPVGRGRPRSPGAVVELAASGPRLGQGACIRAPVPDQVGIGRRLGDDGFDGRVAGADSRCKPGCAAAMAPGGDPALLDLCVLDEDALAHREPRLHVGVRAKLGVAVEVLGVLEQWIEHRGSPGAAARRTSAVNVPAPAGEGFSAIPIGRGRRMVAYGRACQADKDAAGRSHGTGRRCTSRRRRRPLSAWPVACDASALAEPVEHLRARERAQGTCIPMLRRSSISKPSDS